MTVTELQKALKAAGFDPGPIDGVMGRMTIDAVKLFQASKNLSVDGVAGPITQAAFKATTPNRPDTELQSLSMPWFLEAQRNIGVTEDTGRGSNPLIIGWGRRLQINYSNDEIPWCGLFVAHCVGSQLPEEPLPNNPLGARNWSKCGIPCAIPQPGAIMVFWRGSRTSGLGHVAFYVGEDNNSFHVLGGNQGNAVNVTRMPRPRFLEARWPKTAPAPTGAPRKLDPTGALSVTEQ